jgi:hypothetical protein
LQILPSTQRTPASRVAAATGVEPFGGACAGIADGREAAAQRLEGGQLRAQVQALRIEARFERHPDAAEDLRRLAERERLAEALREVVMGIDEAGHQQVLRQIDRLHLRVPLGDIRERADVSEAAVLDDHADVTCRPFRQQRPFRREQHHVGAEGELQGSRVIHRTHLHPVHR